MAEGNLEVNLDLWRKYKMGACFCTGACRIPPYRCPAMDPLSYTDYSRRKDDPKPLPVIPPLPISPAGDGAIAICGECGLRLMPVMGYVCPNIRCPCFPRNIC